MSGPVLRTTKLHPPARRDDVARPGLLEQLAAGLEKRLTVVVAPAGWGKTTLLCGWRAGEAEDVRFAWVSLDDGDNDPVRFWTYFVEALRTIEPELGAATLSLVRNSATSIVDVCCPRSSTSWRPRATGSCSCSTTTT